MEISGGFFSCSQNYVFYSLKFTLTEEILICNGAHIGYLAKPSICNFF